MSERVSVNDHRNGGGGSGEHNRMCLCVFQRDDVVANPHKHHAN